MRDGRAVPTILRRPPEAQDEWQLVAVTVRLLDVARDGDVWRAEATLGAAGDLPIVGLSGSGTSADGLEPGRSARVIGIVKRAHPSASDQRFAIAPRSSADIELGSLTPGDEVEAPGGSHGDPQHRAGLDGAAAAGALAIPAATLDSLPRLADELVRVGGRVERVAGRRLTLDDGTAQADVRLASAIEPFEPALRVDEVLNVVGWVRARPGGPEVVVRSSADVRRTAVAETPVAVSPGEATSLTSGQLPDVATAMRAGDASDRSSGLPLGLLLPLACALAGLAVLLVGGAVVSMAWPSLGGRGQSTGRVPPAQPDDRDPNGTADGVRIGPV